MHELSIAESLIEILKKEKVHLFGRITSATVLIGKLSGVSPDSLEFYFDALKKDTEFSSVVLKIEIGQLVAKCSNCGLEETLSEPIFICSSCKGILTPIHGTELSLKSIEIEEK